MSSFEANPFKIEPLSIVTAKVVEIHGYFAADAGAKLDEVVDEMLRDGAVAIVLDFTPCSIISSPGIAALMDVTLKITEDFIGKVAMCGLDELQRKVLSMAGIISIAPEGGSREAALELVK